MTLQAHVRFTPVVEDVKPDEGGDDRAVEQDLRCHPGASLDGYRPRGVIGAREGAGLSEGHADGRGRPAPRTYAGPQFAKPGERRVLLRLSTNAGGILPDAVSLPRGGALKGLDVPGEGLPDAEGTTQNSS